MLVTVIMSYSIFLIALYLLLSLPPSFIQALIISPLHIIPSPYLSIPSIPNSRLLHSPSLSPISPFLPQSRRQLLTLPFGPRKTSRMRMASPATLKVNYTLKITEIHAKQGEFKFFTHIYLSMFFLSCITVDSTAFSNTYDVLTSNHFRHLMPFTYAVFDIDPTMPAIR